MDVSPSASASDSMIDASAHERAPPYHSSACPQVRRGWHYMIVESSWLFLAILGVTASFLAWVQDEVVTFITAGHELLTATATNGFVQTLIYTVYMLVLVMAAMAATHYIQPNAVGSGIPQMKSYLAGYEVKRYLSLRTLVAKTVGLTLAMGGGLCVGKEGPFVHTSCCVAKQLLNLRIFKEIKDNRE
jgi:chloride channel 2